MKLGHCSHLGPVMTRGQRKVFRAMESTKKVFGKWCAKAVTDLSAHHAQALCRTCLPMLLPICELVLSSVTVDKGMIVDHKWVFCYSSVS